MKLCERTKINASTEAVWEVLSDPSLMELWNPKCVRYMVDQGSARVGMRYKAIFRLSGPEHLSDCEVIDCIPNQLLRTRYSGSAFRNNGYVDETFRLKPVGEQTRLTQEVDFKHSQLPWYVILIMRFISLFGYKAGRSPLDGIKDLLEDLAQQGS